MESAATVTVHGLGQLEARELEALLGKSAKAEESQHLGNSQQGAAAAFQLIVQATPWVAGVLGLWLLKPRRGKTFHKKLTGRDHSGKLREEDIYVHEYEEDSPSEAVVEALSKLFGLGSGVIKKAIQDAVATRGAK
jgi:hypothetical protein